MAAIVAIRMENSKKESTALLIPISMETVQLPKPLVPHIRQQFSDVRRLEPGVCLLILGYLEG